MLANLEPKVAKSKAAVTAKKSTSTKDAKAKLVAKKPATKSSINKDTNK